MKAIFAAAVFCLSLALIPDVSFAAAKKKVLATVGGEKCATVGQTCAMNCSNTWCSRFVCTGKWERRLVGCAQPFCPPACTN